MITEPDRQRVRRHFWGPVGERRHFGLAAAVRASLLALAGEGVMRAPHLTRRRRHAARGIQVLRINAADVLDARRRDDVLATIAARAADR